MNLFLKMLYICAFLYFCCLLIVDITAVKQPLPLPSYVGKPCRADDPNLNECIVRTGTPVIKRIVQGDPKYRIPPLEPLVIEEMRIQQGTPQFGLLMSCKSCKLHGLSETKFIAARADLKKKHIEWDFRLEKLMFLGKYKVTGKVLILPITGDGDANITLTGIDFSFIYDYELIKRDNGLEYCKLQNTTLPYTITSMKIHLDNLFNGDKLLGNNMNQFLNDNWRDILKEVGPAVADALSEVFTKTMGSMADLVPFQYIFPSD